MPAGIKANSDGSAAIQVGGTDVITLTSGGAATFVTSPTTVQAGTAAAPSITFSGDTNTGIYSPGADQVAIATGGTERLRVDSAGNMGLNTSSIVNIDPTSKTLEVYGGAGGGFIHFTNATTGQTVSDGFIIGNSVGGSDALIIQRENANMIFRTNDTERARITSGGDFLVNTTTANGKLAVAVPDGSTTAFYVERTGASAATLSLNFANQYSNWAASGRYQIVAGGSGGVYLASAATSWSSVSDERLKTALNPFENAAQKVCSIRAGTGRYLTDAENVSRSFLIAQDVQAVLPEAIDVENDEQNTLGLRYTDTIPLLVAAIKEQQAMIDELKAKVAALEGA